MAAAARLPRGRTTRPHNIPMAPGTVKAVSSTPASPFCSSRSGTDDDDSDSLVVGSPPRRSSTFDAQFYLDVRMPILPQGELNMLPDYKCQRPRNSILDFEAAASAAALSASAPPTSFHLFGNHSFQNNHDTYGSIAYDDEEQLFPFEEDTVEPLRHHHPRPSARQPLHLRASLPPSSRAVDSDDGQQAKTSSSLLNSLSSRHSSARTCSKASSAASSLQEAQTEITAANPSDEAVNHHSTINLSHKRATVRQMMGIHRSKPIPIPRR
uniref:Uncharacterized protein n=1 Tax=Lotharella oceanica TaxID=641309 RepID=A0A7S2X9N8_9EUKA